MKGDDFRPRRPTTTVTSNPEADQQRAVLGRLRAKAPQRALSRREAERVAEWQATSLLELAQLREAPTPSRLIAEVPRVQVLLDNELPVSGSTHWYHGSWLILLNGLEPRTRQRFSLAHEFKHVIDHRDRQTLYRDRPGQSATDQAELAADYFAACLLMPRRWLQRAWSAGVQDVDQLAELFAVSTAAMSRRLAALGLGRTDTTLPGALYSRRSPGMRRAA